MQGNARLLRPRGGVLQQQVHRRLLFRLTAFFGDLVLGVRQFLLVRGALLLRLGVLFRRLGVHLLVMLSPFLHKGTHGLVE